MYEPMISLHILRGADSIRRRIRKFNSDRSKSLLICYDGAGISYWSRRASNSSAWGRRGHDTRKVEAQSSRPHIRLGSLRHVGCLITLVLKRVWTILQAKKKIQSR